MATDKDTTIILEQYKNYEEGIEKNSDRRGKALSNLISLNSIYIGGIAAVLGFEDHNRWIIITIICLLGAATSTAFLLIIRSYQQLSSGKFEVLHSIELKMPVQPYTDEWKILGEGKNGKKYRPFSNIEKTLPAMFILAYIACLALILLSHNMVITIKLV